MSTVQNLANRIDATLVFARVLNLSMLRWAHSYTSTSDQLSPPPPTPSWQGRSRDNYRSYVEELMRSARRSGTNLTDVADRLSFLANSLQDLKAYTQRLSAQPAGEPGQQALIEEAASRTLQQVTSIENGMRATLAAMWQDSTRRRDSGSALFAAAMTGLAQRTGIRSLENPGRAGGIDPFGIRGQNRDGPLTRLVGPLFAADGERYGENAASWRDVKQGQLGNCWYLAGLAALTRTEAGRRHLKRNIVDNHDGTVTVTFGDGRVVTVDREVYTVNSLSGPIYARGGSGDDTWVQLYEKAAAEREGGYGRLAGGNAGSAWRLIGPTETGGVKPGTDAAKVAGLLAGNYAIVFSGSVRSNSGGINYRGEGSNIFREHSSKHLFSVVGHRTASNGELYITVHNPWGSNAPLDIPNVTPGSMGDDGTFEIAYKDAGKLFDSLSYGKIG